MQLASSWFKIRQTFTETKEVLSYFTDKSAVRCKIGFSSVERLRRREAGRAGRGEPIERGHASLQPQVERSPLSATIGATTAESRQDLFIKLAEVKRLFYEHRAQELHIRSLATY